MTHSAKKSSGITRKFNRPRPLQAAVRLNMDYLSVLPMPGSDYEVREFSQDSGWQQWQDSAGDADSTTSYLATVPMPLHTDESAQVLAAQLDAFASVTRNSA